MQLIHTCYRISDPDRSIAFYEALGLERRRELPIRDEAVNYFLGVPGRDGPVSSSPTTSMTPTYDIGTGYGHVALTVELSRRHPRRSREKGIEPERPPYTVREGGALICFVRDPEAYEARFGSLGR